MNENDFMSIISKELFYICKMETKDKRGGKREGAGRPKVKDKKKTVMLYIRKSTIKFHGGEEKLKAFIHNAIEPKTTSE